MSVEKELIAWSDGEFLPLDDIKIHADEHGLHYADCGIEGLRGNKTDDNNVAIFRERDHTNRLFFTAKMLHLKIPYSKEEIEEIQRYLIRRNKLREDCYFRPHIRNKNRRLGVFDPNPILGFIIYVKPFGRYLGEEVVKRGAKAKISTYARYPPISGAKMSAPYVRSFLAAKEAHDFGCDEAIMPDIRGFISEGPGENLFGVLDGELITPPKSAHILPGITMDTVTIIARDMGYKVKEMDILRGTLYGMDELFFCGTAVEIQPIVEVDRYKIGDGKPGPITTIIREKYENIVRGRVPEYMEWLTFAYPRS